MHWEFEKKRNNTWILIVVSSVCVKVFLSNRINGGQKMTAENSSAMGDQLTHTQFSFSAVGFILSADRPEKNLTFFFFAGRICAASLEMHLKITAHREPYVLFLFLVARGLSLKSQVVSVYKYLDWSLSGKLAESSSSLHSLKILLLFFSLPETD